MKYSTIPVAQTVLHYAVAHGIEHVVISPGSRNAPLTIGFTSHPKIRSYSVVDERSAGFFALGIAQQLQQPVALLCSSGSALLNYYPAISEAYYSDIPLIIISADRPEYRIDIGDGQTIQQDGVYGRHLVYDAPLHQDASHATDTIKQSNRQKILQPNDSIKDIQAIIQQKNQEQLQLAFRAAIQQKGPVHINVPLEEPLYNTTGEPVQFEDLSVPSLFEQNNIEFQALEWCEKADRILILIGTHYPDHKLQQILIHISQDKRFAVLTESTSNLSHSSFFPHIDQIIAPIEKDIYPEYYWKKLRPDVVLSFGGMVISKKIKSYLRNYPPQHHIHLDLKKAYDTYFINVHHVSVTPILFLKELTLKTNISHPYWEEWRVLAEKRKIAHRGFLSNAPFSDLVAFETLFKRIPPNYSVQIANSSPIRYAQLYSYSNVTYCNRGTSGIDGCVSTAVGAAVSSQQPTLLITGDLSFFYDNNGLWSNYIPSHFRVIVINNGGGGIFRVLPGDKTSDMFTTYFETAHNKSAVNLAKHYNFKYTSARTSWGLKRKLNQLFKPSKRPKLLEIKTPSVLNADVLNAYFNYLSKDNELKNIKH